MKEGVEKSKEIAKQIIKAEGYCTDYSKSVCFDCPCYLECGLNSNIIDKHNRVVTCNKYLNEHKEVQHTICAVCGKENNRDFFGIELDSKYYEICKQRISEAKEGLPIIAF